MTASPRLRESSQLSYGAKSRIDLGQSHANDPETRCTGSLKTRFLLS
jgi:hypothetical protein